MGRDGRLRSLLVRACAGRAGGGVRDPRAVDARLRRDQRVRADARRRGDDPREVLDAHFGGGTAEAIQEAGEGSTQDVEAHRRGLAQSRETRPVRPGGRGHGRQDEHRAPRNLAPDSGRLETLRASRRDRHGDRRDRGRHAPPRHGASRADRKLRQRAGGRVTTLPRLMAGKGIAGVFAAGLAAAALGSTALAGSVAKQATSFPTAQNGRIVFSSTRDTAGNDIDVFIANADGSGAVNLTPGNPGVDSYHPSLSPDGTKILFARDPGSSDTSNAHVYVMNVDGSNPVDLTPGNTASKINDDYPSFSPDSKRIVFVSRRADVHGDIFVMNADGSSPTNVTPTDVLADRAPEWSPDGARIFFDHDLAGNEHIAVMNADGSGVQDLGAASDAPSPSPDGTKITFGREIGTTFHIFVANVDGSGAKDMMPGGTLSSFDPEFSPDNKRILFVQDIDPAGGVFKYEVMVMNADGTGLTQVTHTSTTTDSYDPGWESVYTCGGPRATIIGTQAGEKISGTKHADVIVALGGNDKVSGKGASDRICGGDGKDKLSGGSGNDKLYGQAGKDTLTGGKGKDKLAGGPGKDKQKQ